MTSDKPRRLAFELASAGFKVVPLKGKAPFWKQWTERGLSDPLDVLDKWPMSEEFWPGVLTGEGCVVLDVDHKSGTRDGLAQLAALEAEIGPLPKTYTVKTPSGGLHLYFKPRQGEAYPKGKLRTRDGAIIQSIDVESYGGQVVAGRSVINGGEYVVVHDIAMAEVPPALSERLRIAPMPTNRGEGTDAAEDLPGAREKGEAYIASRPVVSTGGRDSAGINVAFQLYNFGCSRSTMVELLHRFNETKLDPPKDTDDPEGPEQWASRPAVSAQRAFGEDNPPTAFKPVPDFQAIERATAFATRIRPYTATEESDAAIPVRPWVVSKIALRAAVTVLAAPGSTGKSLWALQLALAVALGDVAPKLIGCEVAETTPVLVVNNEDGDDELDRRLAAVTQWFGIDRKRAHGRVHLLSGARQKFKLIMRTKDGATEGPELEMLRKYIVEHGIGLIVFDPLVSLHDLQETDNTDMQVVMDCLTSLAATLSISIVVISHTPKPPLASSDSYAGTINAIRGATAITNAARVALTMFGMSEDDAERYAIGEKVRGRYVRLDDAKQNLALASPDASWFRKESVALKNGEELGVLVPVSLKQDDRARGAALLRELADLIEPHGLSMAKAINSLQHMAEYRKVSDKKMGDRLRALFLNNSADSEGRRLSFVPEGKTGGTFYVER